ncbi:MAG TPA: hypothetical protein VF712_00625 [Thermoleophilaceae bacterium]|jgi:hypothetical protein
MSEKDKGKKPDEPVSPTRSAQDKRREKSVAEFDRQVSEGTVTIRQMTPAERKANPPRERPAKGKGSRRS